MTDDPPPAVEASTTLPTLIHALGTVAEAVLITDASQAIVFANAGFTDMTGYREAELLGVNCRILQGPDSDSEVRALIRLCLANGEQFRGQILNYRKDGSPFWNALSISPVRDDDGAITHFISVQRDVTAHHAISGLSTTGPATRSTPATEASSEASYRERLLDGGLRMYLQPVVDLRTGLTERLEALARLELEDGTLISPSAFLPLLSERDVAAVFRHGLDDVLGQLGAWDREGLHVSASINLAPSVLRDPGCVGWVADALERYAVGASRLGIELLETDLLHDRVQLEAFDDLRALGVAMTMDDLGAGHSGLRRLVKLPFDAIKVDGALVAQLRVRPVPALAMLATLIQMGRDHGWDVVIEGLEDSGLTQAVAILGAPYGQGYFLCAPLPPQDVPAWLAQDAASYGELTTLGALAYHWRLHRTGSPHDGPLDACPITAVVAAAGDPEPEEWHAQQHGTAATVEAGDRLLEWLTDAVQQELES